MIEKGTRIIFRDFALGLSKSQLWFGDVTANLKSNENLVLTIIGETNQDLLKSKDI